MAPVTAGMDEDTQRELFQGQRGGTKSWELQWWGRKCVIGAEVLKARRAVRGLELGFRKGADGGGGKQLAAESESKSESIRLEKISEMIKSNSRPNTLRGNGLVQCLKGIPPWPLLKLSEQQLGGRGFLEKPVAVILKTK